MTSRNGIRLKRNLHEAQPRQQIRRRTIKVGRIVYNLNRSSLDVQIADISQSGAKLRLGSLWICPSVFELEILNPNTGRPDLRRCERMWQRGLEIGVRFLD
jgi:hypothetical protein